MRIGLLSDTHSYLDDKLFTHFRDCDEIWHAGDIGTMELADQLAAFKPLRAVFGNIDDKTLQARFPEDVWLEVEGLTIWMTHIGGAPPNYNPRIKKKLKTKAPDIFICGHSHILRIKRDPAFAQMLYLNPGAAGNHGFHHMRTAVRFEIRGGQLQNMELIELGKRGALVD